MKGYSLDPHPKANAAKEEFAVALIPRLKRERVPANNVEIVKDLQTAMDKSDPDNNFYAVKVVGPARSSEGVFLYYILDMYNA
jgi:hypothetical protein